MKNDLLLMGPLLPQTMRELEETYSVHRYDQAADRAALLAELAPRLQAIATRGDYPLGADVMDALPNVKIISSSGAGYDAIDIDAAKARGIAVCNTPDVLTECVADAAWALILSTVRRTVFNDKYVRAGKWLNGPAPLTEKVWGRSLGILGYGRIGKAVARRGEAFGMDIAYHDVAPQEVSHRFYGSPVDLARNVSILVVCLAGREATRGMVNREVIDALGENGYLINVSRGSTVDEPCLVAALVDGRLAGAGLDVYANEPNVPEALFELDNVVLQPHLASGTRETRNAMGQRVVDNLAAFFAGKPLLSAIS